MATPRAAVPLLALALAACDHDPRGRCVSADECLGGQVCAEGVCAAAPPAAPNRAPAAVEDGYTVPAGATLSVAAAAGVLANDSDPDGDALAAERASSAAHGVAYLSLDGSFVYVPATGFTGTDTLTYRASDGALRSAVTTVVITVTPP